MMKRIFILVVFIVAMIIGFFSYKSTDGYVASNTTSGTNTLSSHTLSDISEDIIPLDFGNPLNSSLSYEETSTAEYNRNVVDLALYRINPDLQLRLSKNDPVIYENYIVWDILKDSDPKFKVILDYNLDIKGLVGVFSSDEISSVFPMDDLIVNQSYQGQPAFTYGALYNLPAPSTETSTLQFEEKTLPTTSDSASSDLPNVYLPHGQVLPQDFINAVLGFDGSPTSFDKVYFYGDYIFAHKGVSFDVIDLNTYDLVAKCSDTLTPTISYNGLACKEVDTHEDID